MRYLTGFALSVCLVASVPAVAAPSMTIDHLRCENVSNPLGIEAEQPRLGWKLASDARGAKQEAYRVLVASRPELLSKEQGDLWDSGQVRSDQTTQIAYAGKPLVSGQRAHWKVRVVDAAGKAFESQPAFWEMGLLRQSDWHGQWIGYVPPTWGNDATPTLEKASWIWYPEGDPTKTAPVGTRWFRRTITVPTGRALQSAVLRVAADNAAVIYLNGKEIGRARDSWKSRTTFDVRSNLVAGTGANVLAIAVSNEAPAGPAGLAAELDVKFAEGEPLSVVTDGNWKTSNRESEGWQNTAFNDANWEAAKKVAAVGSAPWGKVANGSIITAPPAPYLRHSFTLDGKIKRATAYICGLGLYEMSLNGRKVGDHVLDPAWTRYDRRSLYVTYDVTEQLKNGRNAVGVVLGTGHYDDHVLAVWDFEKAPWRAHPKMMLEMRVEYEDGRQQIISSNDGWKASNGPLLFDSISGGERYDARLEKAGWDTPDYDDGAWEKAQVMEPVKGTLAAQTAPPIRNTQVLTPMKLSEPTPGVWVFDMGQNFAGVPQLRVSGPAGAKVVMRCAEKLHEDGSLDASNLDYFLHRRDPQQLFQTDSYVLKGQGREVWQPRFSYHGFQYVEVTGFPGRPTLDNLRGLVQHSDFDSVGTFECSDAMLNRTQRNARWAYLSNFHGYPSDCPHREKNGWTGDAHLAAEMGLYNFDGAANYERWLDDIHDEQKETGALPGIVPTGGWGYDRLNGPAWDSAYPLIVWYLYQYRGDKRILAKHYDRLKLYVDYVTSRSKDGIVGFGLNDWVPAKTKTAADVTDTGYYYADSRIVAQIAEILGKSEDARRYFDLAKSIKTAFNAKFYHPETHTYANGSLTAISCALYQGLVDEANKPAVVEALVAEVKKQGYHMDVGILGAKYILNALAENGRADVAYQMLMQKTWPSYGYWVEQGATTLWEEWNGNQSRNHIMFGDVSAWFYKYLAGIQAGSPGFKTIVLQPHVLGNLTSARATYDSVQGTIVSDWQIEGGSFRWQVSVPANTTATVMVPCAEGVAITEKGRPIAETPALRFLRREKGSAVYAAPAGSYRFACPVLKPGSV